MQTAIKKVVILGGGTAGWMSAAMIKKLIGQAVEIELVESESIGTIGVGEATIPPIKLFNSVLGINEAEFIRETKATIKLGIKFENWKTQGERYFHSFGAAGRSLAFCQFHHLLKRAGQLDDDKHLWQYDLNFLMAEAGKFSPINSQDPTYDVPYAYHFDAGLYAAFLKRFSQKIGVKRTEGLVEHVKQNQITGFIECLMLKGGKEVSGDLFIDCSGFKGLLIQEKLSTGYEDWSHWLQCDRAIAVPSKRFEQTLNYTRSIAHPAGWQWRIPLQHRNGNGLVYSSKHYTDQQAQDILLSNLQSDTLGEPNLLRFATGRRKKQWNKNVVSIGLSSGFLEPLESTSIHLIQSAIIRLVHMFPHAGVNDSLINEFNKQSKLEFEQIRDFLILHYKVNERRDSLFWNDMRTMDIPDSLAHKIQIFKENGRLFREQNDLFQDSSWLQVMVGQGLIPNDYHPIANSIPTSQLMGMLEQVKTMKEKPIAALPSHDEFLAKLVKT
ncbi:tryptophan halogenase family protein [Algibacillus agarilyticus]|uniref:tryptophan halogenase family protein n=1 Tax=Algibacillus agarilyticus TaxID=2234133 RepID=UPI000DCFE5A0|nr:tryptophan halogenase family protein [Algibacillus agarilyticus]